MPWQNQVVVRAQQVIVSGGTTSGVYIYSGTPALGNVPEVAITGGTKDPFGNTVLPSDTFATATLFVVYGTGGSYIQIAPQSGVAAMFMGTGDASESSPGFIDSNISGSGGTRQAVTEVLAPALGNNPCSIQLFSASADNTVHNLAVVNADRITLNSTAVANCPSPKPGMFTLGNAWNAVEAAHANSNFSMILSFLANLGIAS